MPARFPWLTLLRRYLFIAFFAYWIGGFTFYGSVVVHMAARVLSGGEAEFGFVTRQVTFWLNLIGGVALLCFLWELLSDWHCQGRLTRRARAVLWLGLVICQIAIVLMRASLNKMLDPDTQTIHSRAKFHALHEVYLTLSGIQWALGLIFLALTLAGWLTPRASSDLLVTQSASEHVNSPIEAT